MTSLLNWPKHHKFGMRSTTCQHYSVFVSIYFHPTALWLILRASLLRYFGRINNKLHQNASDIKLHQQK